MSRLLRVLFIVTFLSGLSLQAHAASDLLKQQEGDMVLGDAKAPVTIIEYSSLSCPHCADFSKNTLPELTKKYIDEGKVKLVHRDFPLNEPAYRASLLAHCAGEKDQKRYFNFTKVLFETQENWAFHKNFLERLSNIGKLGGISGDTFDKCMEDKKLGDKILGMKQAAVKELDVNATPTFYINGQKYESAHDVEAFSAAIDKLLADKPAAKKEEKKKD